MTLTTYGKNMRALSMYGKGRAFLLAAALLNGSMEKRGHRSEATEYVVLHLLCQGIETALKGLLLLHDFDHWNGRQKKTLGHRLLRVSEEALAAFRQRPLRGKVRVELAHLDALYRLHRLRYASVQDEVVAPTTIATERTWLRVRAMLRLAEREMKKVGLLPE
ncbi:MAG TPA: hypothetical protein P5024_09340 [Burkholderiaceae bacterium]|nr:hypothetical protein [Burkholderiaceae bacterium]HRZ01749.1 hypothetical protein [Burkholderiaceae bacterium]